jgi:drug/metabolite transporter (DMT)-like permease
MDLFVFAAVLAAAVMHAGWNACVKAGADRFSSVLLLSLVQGGISAVLIPFFPAPLAQSYPYLAASACLHAGYKLFLGRAYEHGDMSQVYPIARGTAPLLVAIAGALWLGEVLPGAKLAAIVAISLGVLLMAFGRVSRQRRITPEALAFALATAGFTASYTLVDGTGARLAATASGFILWLQLLDAILMGGYALATRGTEAFRRLRPAVAFAVPAGMMALGSYWVATWAFTQAPVALVAALRETSVLFAMLFGLFLFREPVTTVRWVAASLILTGLVAMQLG